MLKKVLFDAADNVRINFIPSGQSKWGKIQFQIFTRNGNLKAEATVSLKTWESIFEAYFELKKQAYKEEDIKGMIWLP